MIFNSDPADWKDLQEKVCQVFLEIGCFAETGKTIETVRGEVEIDVYVKDATKKPEMIYFCECKNWNTPVPQTVIHAFQTVVSNYGAHLGYIISKKGFQRGAYNATKNSNVQLLTWTKFQEMYFDTWKSAMFKKLSQSAEPFSKYYDYLGGPLFPQDSADQREYQRLCNKYNLLFEFSPYTRIFREELLKFPKDCIDPRGDKNEMKKIVITNYRDLFNIFIEARDSGIEAFENFRLFLKNKHGSN